VHDHQRVMVVAMREALQKHVVSGGGVSGEKRGRDESSDFEDEDGFKEAMAVAEGGA